MVCNIGRSVAIDLIPLQRDLRLRKAKLLTKTNEAANDATKTVTLIIHFAMQEGIVDIMANDRSKHLHLAFASDLEAGQHASHFS